MYYRISNTAERTTIEAQFKRSFKYPSLYEPNQLINGLNESTLSLITMGDKEYIDFAIWGLLPQNFKDEWQVLQQTFNTLNISTKQLHSGNWYGNAFHRRRCLILVTGFFTSYLYQGEVYPYYVHMPDEAPFCLAGVYNVLADGFISCAILLGESKGIVQKIQNLGNEMPLIVAPEMYDRWLEPTLAPEVVRHEILANSHPEIKAHPIAKQLYNEDIVYGSMLDPVNYMNIPIPREY